jgi:hypothetical protein
MVRAFSAYLDFCYLVRRSVINEDTLDAIDNALDRFHTHRAIFQTTGVRVAGPEGFMLPRQHAMIHYHQHITNFGAPNGLCSSITESKHIKAVKEPWRRSSKFNALGQMLLTNQRLDKLHAARVDFVIRGMLPGSALSQAMDSVLGQGQPVANTNTTDNTQDGPVDPEDEVMPVEGPLVMNFVELPKERGASAMLSPFSCSTDSNISLARKTPTKLNEIIVKVGRPNLKTMICRFLHDQLYPDDERDTNTIPIHLLPEINSRFKIFHSASATIYAPSDPSGRSGMLREYIRANPSWGKGPDAVPRFDTVFVETDADEEGMHGMHVARVRMFFSFKHEGVVYPCALVEWFERVDDTPDADTGMWIVEPELDEFDARSASIVHIDTILRAAHLLPIFGPQFVSHTLHFSQTLDAWNAYYVNKYVDHHANEIVF